MSNQVSQEQHPVSHAAQATRKEPTTLSNSSNEVPTSKERFDNSDAVNAPISNAAVSEGRLATQEDEDDNEWTPIETKTKSQRQRRQPAVKENIASKRSWRKDKTQQRSRSTVTSPPNAQSESDTHRPSSADEATSLNTAAKGSNKSSRSKKKQQRSAKLETAKQPPESSAETTSQTSGTAAGSEGSVKYQPPVTPNVMGAWRKPITDVIKQTRSHPPLKAETGGEKEQIALAVTSPQASCEAVVMPPSTKQQTQTAGKAVNSIGSSSQSKDKSDNGGVVLPVSFDGTLSKVSVSETSAVRMPAPSVPLKQVGTASVLSGSSSPTPRLKDVVTDNEILSEPKAIAPATQQADQQHQQSQQKGWAKPSHQQQPAPLPKTKEQPANEQAWPALHAINQQDATDNKSKLGEPSADPIPAANENSISDTSDPSSKVCCSLCYFVPALIVPAG